MKFFLKPSESHILLYISIFKSLLLMPIMMQQGRNDENFSYCKEEHLFHEYLKHPMPIRKYSK